MDNEHEPKIKSSPKEKLSQMKIETRIELQHFRELRNLGESNNPNTQEAQQKMAEQLSSEKEELKKIADETNDALALAEAETREKEIEKELIEIKIEWLEKEAYDFHVDTSPRKTEILNKITWLKQGGLLLAIINCVGALRDEQRLLIETGKNENDEKRGKYVDEQIKKLENEFREIEKLGD